MEPVTYTCFEFTRAEAILYIIDELLKENNNTLCNRLYNEGGLTESFEIYPSTDDDLSELELRLKIINHLSKNGD